MNQVVPQALSGMSGDPASPLVDTDASSTLESGRWAAWPLTSALPPMGALASAPGTARAHVRAVRAEWGLSAATDESEVVTSELVTNALNASTPPGGGPFYVNGRMPVIRLCIMSDGSQCSSKSTTRRSARPTCGTSTPRPPRPGAAYTWSSGSPAASGAGT